MTPSIATRAWGWLWGIVKASLPARKAYMAATLRIAISFTILWAVAYLPTFLQSPMTFVGNLFFYFSFVSLVGPAEHAVTNGVVDKVDAHLAQLMSGKEGG